MMASKVVRTIILSYLWVNHSIPVHISPIQTHRDDPSTYQDLHYNHTGTNLDRTVIWTCPNQDCLHCINQASEVSNEADEKCWQPTFDRLTWHCEGVGRKLCELYDLMGGLWVWMVVQAVCWRNNINETQKPWCKHASSAANQTRVHSWP